MRSGCCCCWSPPRTHYYPPPPDKARAAGVEQKISLLDPEKEGYDPISIIKEAAQHMPSYRSPAQMTHCIHTNLKNAARSQTK